MGDLYQITYQVLERDASIVEDLEVSSRGLWADIADRVSWHRSHFQADIEVMGVRPAQVRVETQVCDHAGIPLCRYCLDPATNTCAMCGWYCCDNHGWFLKDEYTPPEGHVECIECMSK